LLTHSGEAVYIKAMIKMENGGLNRIWLSTNTPSKRVGQLVRNAKACIYFVDFEQWTGLMLVGEVEVLQDTESRQRLWREGFEKYYPLGVADPDYCVLRFTARSGDCCPRILLACGPWMSYNSVGSSLAVRSCL